MINSDEFVNIAVRIKPLSNETANNRSSCFQVISQKPAILLVPEKRQTYHFDHIFSEEDDQKFVYNETVKKLVDNVKLGYNCTVFAYGQTGCGKTYTMGMNPEITKECDEGVIGRTLKDLFEATLDENIEAEIQVSFWEIYNEKVFDLLNNDSRIPLSIKGFSVKNFRKEKVFSAYDAIQFLLNGSKNRHTGSTNQNSRSSRSHAIFTVYCNIKHCNHETDAKLNLVDLAGSESVKKTGNQGSKFQEGVNINKGLLCIGQVMSALSKNSSHIPYRQSIITTILQDSLNKRNFVSLIACLSSNTDDLAETIQTLEFAHRVKKLKNKPEVNQIVSQFKSDNPSLFMKPPQMTPMKTSTICNTPFKLPTATSSLLKEQVQSTPLNSRNPSFSSFDSLPESELENISPIIKKYLDAIEKTIVERMETLIANTLKVSAPDTIRKIIRNEFLHEKVRISKEIRNPLHDSTNVVRNLQFDNTNSFNEEDIQNEKDNSVRRSERLKRRISQLHHSNQQLFDINCNDKENEVLLFKVPKLSQRPNKKTVSRRSVRLQLKQTQNNTTSNCLNPPPTHSDQILQILNSRQSSQIAKLQTIGIKTAEKICLLRQSNGDFTKISDLKEMPGWGPKRYENFLYNNFLIDD